MAKDVEGELGAENVCVTCVFYAAEFSQNGHCHAHPPLFDRGWDVSKFPSVRSTDWCGEWKAKVNNASTE